MPIVQTPGIYLPNGDFLPNKGDGHAKNAIRFCEQYEELDKLRISSVLPPDEFLLEAGCAIVAAYRGTRCFKIAKNNDLLEMTKLRAMYEQNGYEIWPYWEINPESKRTLLTTLNPTCEADIESNVEIKTDFILKPETNVYQRYNSYTFSQSNFSNSLKSKRVIDFTEKFYLQIIPNLDYIKSRGITKYESQK